MAEAAIGVSETSLIGASWEDLPTPALLIDIEALERNIARMARAAASNGVRLRPHAKAHKCLEIVTRQLAHGALGICCQTVREVEAFAGAGVGDIVLTNQVADLPKARRLAAIPSRVKLGVCVDGPEQVSLLEQAAVETGRVLDVYLEVEVGGGRCGVCNVPAALALAQRLKSSAMLRFAGLQAYQGRAQHILAVADRRAAAAAAAAAAQGYVAELRKLALAPGVVSGGGTGTAEFDVEFGVLSELQCGSYALMDHDYAQNEVSAVWAFEQAIFVLTRVISNAAGASVVIDAGLKALALDSGAPSVRGDSGLIYSRPSDEHALIYAHGASKPPSVGALLQLTPDHCDPTVACYAQAFVIRAGQVEEIWRPFGARRVVERSFWRRARNTEEP